MFPNDPAKTIISLTNNPAVLVQLIVLVPPVVVVIPVKDDVPVTALIVVA